MKYLSIFLLITISLAANGQHGLKQLWETDKVLPEPESVLITRDFLYVSLVDGQALDKDGKGGIAKVGLNGKILNANWVSGLDGPKGMGLWKDKLYVANITEVDVISTLTGRVESKIPVPGSVGLNDLVIDQHGTVYVSDTENGNVYRLINDKPAVYLANLSHPNGLQAIGDILYVLTASDVFKIDASKNLMSIGKSREGADGLAYTAKGEFITTVYSGLIYYLSNNRKEQLLLDSRAQKKSSADIGYDASKRIVYVPTLFRKSIIAYHLE
ncbi:hypothetical protein HDE69_002976 [Pedobacter cryoconitis]|uniref:ATP/GTP-binding protein n=1 Tax=Pedobacter cryoconitis TaxID=188932 RepID=A0A7W8YUM3_9SPHI|nr:ATP/GTP-binding protein [Pedobacter cryoconitis]MBB5621913.1 hypothetical protein [Pedobacter cryoconitis]